MTTKITISRNDILGRWTGERMTSVLALISHGQFTQITVAPILWAVLINDLKVFKFNIELRTVEGGLAIGFVNNSVGTVILVDSTLDSPATIIAINDKAEYTEFDLTDIFS